MTVSKIIFVAIAYSGVSHRRKPGYTAPVAPPPPLPPPPRAVVSIVLLQSPRKFGASWSFARAVVDVVTL